MVAGPNGSGKTTLTQWLRNRGIEFGEYINPDDIADKLEGSYSARIAKAQIIADERREACIRARRSFSFETVMSHPSKVETLTHAKVEGFFVQLFFVGTDDPRTNVERVALRVAQGGHDVPEDRIVARWARSMKLLHQAIRSADEAFVFDNSSVEHRYTGSRLVFHSVKQSLLGGKIANLLVYTDYPPIPNWLRHYVLKPLRMKPV
jgi:predicted ABC-type ATPase